jgi:Leucine-rich repeat (LRR) protein
MQEAIQRIDLWKSTIVNGYIVLDLENLNLTELPPIPSNCLMLNCQNNKLTFLPNLNVVKLNCSNNLLTELPNLPYCSILKCDNNKLTKIPYLPNCNYLYCNNNLLTYFPNLPKYLPKIQDIYVDGNKYLYVKPKNLHHHDTYICNSRELNHSINYNKCALIVQGAYKKYLIKKYKVLLVNYLLKGPLSIVCAYF